MSPPPLKVPSGADRPIAPPLPCYATVYDHSLYGNMYQKMEDISLILIQLAKRCYSNVLLHQILQRLVVKDLIYD